MNCPKCGAENPAANKFCDTCGSKLSHQEKLAEKDKKKPVPAPPAPVKAAAAAVAERPVAYANAQGFNLIQWLSHQENFFWLLIWVVGSFLIFLNLGMKPLHHDESLHSFYSWELFQGKGYQYNPMMHGPLLFHVNALIYFLFGASDFTCRIYPAVAGVLCLVLVYMCRPYLGRTGALITGLFMAISPSFVYFARFIRNDTPIALYTLMMLFGMFKYFESQRPKYLYFSFLGLVLSFAAKEVTYITGEMFCVFLAFRWLWENANRETEKNVLMHSLKRVFLEDRKQLWTALAIFFGITFLLYTTFFTNLQGFADAFTKSLSYWLGQHEVQRGSQPVYFYLGLISLFETPFILGALAALGYYSFIKNRENRLWHVLAYVIVAAAWWLFNLQGKETFGLIFSLLLVALGVGMLAYFSFSTLGNFVSFLMLWTVAAISNYSFAGERMPWLILHPLLPMLLLTCYWAGECWDRFQARRWVLLVVGGSAGLMLLHGTVMVNYYGKGANPAELLVYVQSSTDVPQVVRQIKNMSLRLTGGYDMKITCEDYCSWPFAWYLRDFKNVGYPKYTSTQAVGTIDENPLIISGVEMAAPGHDERVAQLLAEKYVAQRYKLRVWWAPDAQAFFNDSLDGKLKKAWNLFFYREPWSGLGSYDMIVYVRKDVANLYWSNVE